MIIIYTLFGLLAIWAFVYPLVDMILDYYKENKPRKKNQIPLAQVSKFYYQDCLWSLGGGWYLYECVFEMKCGAKLYGTIEGKHPSEIESHKHIRWNTFKEGEAK